MKTSIRLFAITILVLTGFALLLKAQAVDPPPDGCYPNFTTAEGCDALNSLTTGAGNTALGWRSLFLNTDGSFNTGVGGGALARNNADSNTAVGAAALLLNTTGTINTAVGTDALVFNDTGYNNTAVGAFALLNNIDGFRNNAFGDDALFTHEMGAYNNAFGSFALYADQSGTFNNAFGDAALESNVSGINNTAVGDLALRYSTGDYNTALGAGAGIDQDIGSNNIYIGDMGVAGDNNVIAIGAVAASGTAYENTYIGGIYDSVVTDRIVYVDVNGHIGTLASSLRYKEEVKPMDNASEALFGLKPVTFRYKQQIDPTRKLSFGLIAEDVAKIGPDLVSCDKEGRPQTVRYEAVNAMLLNEFLKEHRRVEELKSAMAQQREDFEAAIVQQQETTEALVARLNEQEARIQKVSAQVETPKSGSRMLVENR